MFVLKIIYQSQDEVGSVMLSNPITYISIKDNVVKFVAGVNEHSKISVAMKNIEHVLECFQYVQDCSYLGMCRFDNDVESGVLIIDQISNRVGYTQVMDIDIEKALRLINKPEYKDKWRFDVQLTYNIIKDMEGTA